MKLGIKLDALETVNAICAICQKYRQYFETDVCCGRYVTDGISVLGVASMMGNWVDIKPLCEDESLLKSFVKEMSEIGAQAY